MKPSPQRRLMCVVWLLLFGLVAAAQVKPSFGRITQPKFQKFFSQIGNFEVEYPTGRDWTVLSGRGEAILMIAENRTGAALVVIEREDVPGVVGPGDVPELAKAEARAAPQYERGAADVRETVLEAEKRVVAVVTFTRDGIKGREQFFRYVIPIGQSLYRVTCSVVEKEVAKYAPIFGHIAASLQIPPPPKK